MFGARLMIRMGARIVIMNGEPTQFDDIADAKLDAIGRVRAAPA